VRDPFVTINLENLREQSMDNSLISILGTTAFGLMIIVTLGIVFLTVSGWRDRQRREQDKRASR
jgi:hypothetical protein